MTIEFKLPELGENVESGDVVKVLVKEGDVIEANEGICELETDKAVVEIPCPYAGKVVEVRFKQGDTVRVGQTLLVIEPTEAVVEAAVATPPKEDTKTAEPETTTVQPDSAPKPKEPEEAPVETVELASQEVAGTSVAATSSADLIPAGPAARRLARELGVDLAQVQGTGKGGRITPEDVQRAALQQADTVRAKEPSATPQAPPTQATVPPGEPSQDAWGPVRRQKMPRIRQTIAAQMVRSVSTIPHVTNFDDADVTELDNLRRQVPPDYLGAGVKLTLMPFVLKAVATALRRHPVLNASLDEEKQEIVYKEYVHIGVAVDTPRGLVVPVLRNVDRMSLAEIARALAQLAQRARSADFTIDELRGGSFTVSNLGAVGGTYSTPIINYPEVAILLLGRARWLPVVTDSAKIEPRLMLPLSLSYDHRLIDGAQAARFLNDVKQLLQAPGALLLTQ